MNLVGGENQTNTSVIQLSAVKTFSVSNRGSLRLAVVFLRSFILWTRQHSPNLEFNERSTGKSCGNSDC